MEHLKISKSDARFGWLVMLGAFAVLCVASFGPDVMGWF